MANHNELGIKGELLACEHLEKNGHNILEKNWRYKHLEIDIISIHNKTLVFTEVKTRKTNLFGEPEQSVSLKKQKLVIKAANEYLKSIDESLYLDIQFDIISIILNSSTYHINWIKEAFYPTL